MSPPLATVRLVIRNADGYSLGSRFVFPQAGDLADLHRLIARAARPGGREVTAEMTLESAAAFAGIRREHLPPDLAIEVGRRRVQIRYVEPEALEGDVVERARAAAILSKHPEAVIERLREAGRRGAYRRWVEGGLKAATRRRRK